MVLRATLSIGCFSSSIVVFENYICMHAGRQMCLAVHQTIAKNNDVSEELKIYWSIFFARMSPAIAQHLLLPVLQVHC